MRPGAQAAAAVVPPPAAPARDEQRVKELAATRVQSIHRGRAARQQRAEAAAAATRLQARQRGRAGRRRAAGSRVLEADQTDAPEVEGLISAFP